MSEDLTDVRVVTTDDIDVAALVFARGFHDDPLWAWSFPHEGKRLAQQQAFWGFCVAEAIRYPWTFLAAHDSTATCWIPPGGTELSPAGAEQFAPVLHDLVGDGATPVLELFETLDASHPHDEPHFYLSLFATEPAARGNAFGQALLRHNLELIDQEGASAYLESSNSRNVAMYERHGFTVVQTVAGPPGCPDFAGLWRDARP
ncbi:MAG: GNAT family N-acetyltransferase [Thermoleophilia bacterium]